MSKRITIKELDEKMKEQNIIIKQQGERIKELSERIDKLYDSKKPKKIKTNKYKIVLITYEMLKYYGDEAKKLVIVKDVKMMETNYNNHNIGKISILDEMECEKEIEKDDIYKVLRYVYKDYLLSKESDTIMIEENRLKKEDIKVIFENEKEMRKVLRSEIEVINKKIEHKITDNKIGKLTEEEKGLFVNSFKDVEGKLLIKVFEEYKYYGKNLKYVEITKSSNMPYYNNSLEGKIKEIRIQSRKLCAMMLIISCGEEIKISYDGIGKEKGIYVCVEEDKLLSVAMKTNEMMENKENMEEIVEEYIEENGIKVSDMLMETIKEIM